MATGKSQNNQMSSLIQKQIIKFMNNINPNFLNMVNMMVSSGNQFKFALNIFDVDMSNSWIIDYGASNHMSWNVALFDSLYPKRCI